MTNEIKKQVLSSAENGLITSSKITELGFHRSILTELVNSGDIIQLRRGIYIMADEWEDEYALLQAKYKKGVFSHSTALYLLGYSERVPLSFHMSFPTSYNSSTIRDENVVVSRIGKEKYERDIIDVQTPGGNTVRVYNLERSLCDVLRGRGEDIQIIHYAMRKYASSQEKDINLLMECAANLRVESKVRRYMEVLL